MNARLIPIIILALGIGGCGPSGNEGSISLGAPLAEVQLLPSDAWAFEDSTLWTSDKRVLDLVKPGEQTLGIRRPGAVATIKGTESVSDFHLTARVNSTQRTDVVGRDVILVFGYRSPEEFYYAHLSNDNTVMPHNGIFIVDHADRRRIDDQGLENPPEARLDDEEWHSVRVDRNAGTGEIRVFMDNLRTPLMTATDTTFASGAIGFGSFDDTGSIQSIRLLSGTPPLVDPIPLTLEKGLALQLEPFAVIPASDTTGGPKARINFLSSAPDETGRLFVNDLRGKLYVIQDGAVREYLDVRSPAPDFVDAPGLGSGFGFFAFHPEFAQNGKLYTVHTEAGNALTNRAADYSNGAGDVIQGVLIEWTADDPSAASFSGTSREVLRLGFQAVLHGVQQIGFDPNAEPGEESYGLLYLSVGDGESPGSQTENPQSLAAHNGKILRIDPLGSNGPNGQYGIPATNPFSGRDDALGEVWARGLRNPHRFSWDRLTRQMYIGHIGEARVESIFPGRAGANYGWNHREGGFRYEKADPSNVYAPSDRDWGYTEPLARLDHDDIAALSGGFVYRGERLPALEGKYLFGDIVSGRVYFVEASDLERGEGDADIRNVSLLDSGNTERTFDHFSGSPRADLRFSMDEKGEIYLLSKANGTIWAITSAAEAR